MFEVSNYGGGYLSCIIAILYFASVYGLEKFGSSIFAKPWFRGFLADFSFVFPTLFWVGFSHFPGRLSKSDLYFLPIGQAFRPTQPRGWIIEFWSLRMDWVFIAVPFGFLMMLLFYYDHVSVLTSNLSLRLEL
jgi:hypothetical protein